MDAKVNTAVCKGLLTGLLFRYPKDWDIPTSFNFSIFGWGHNHRGQLGGVDGNKVKVPRICDSFGEVSPVQITGGEQTLFAVTADGKVNVLCLSVCTCVCVCVSVCLSICVCLSVCVSAYLSICMYVCMYLFIHACACLYVLSVCMYVCGHVYSCCVGVCYWLRSVRPARRRWNR